MRVAGVGLLCSAGIGAAGARGGAPGRVPGFRARDHVPRRKEIKLMSRAVQLGVAAVRQALEGSPGWSEVAPERRAIFTASTPIGAGLDDLLPALEASMDQRGRVDPVRFGREGLPRLHPLWLVRGLSNNLLGFASAFFDLRGVNANYCEGGTGGARALVEGWRAVAEGRADLAVAGAADCWIGAERLLGGEAAGEGAAMLVFRRGEGRWLVEPGHAVGCEPEYRRLGRLGVASWPVTVARRLLRGDLEAPLALGGPKLRSASARIRMAAAPQPRRKEA